MLANRIARYVPLAAWVVAVLTLFLIPAKILSYGYLPGDDALRHAAKVVSGKPWQDILVMRSDFALDPHPGWHAVLGWIYRWQDCSAETLVVIAVFGLMLLVSAAVLPWFKRPETWLAALLVVSVAAPTYVKRLTLARPFLFTMGVYLTLLLMWSRSSKQRPHPAVMLATVLLIAAAACIHGTFYQMILPAAGLVLAGRWRQAIWFGACWALGSLLGASLTGHPWQFLDQSIRHLLGVFGHHSVSRQLVSEFYPSDGDAMVVLAVIAMLLWRARSPNWRARDLVNPIFLMAVAGWVLGFATGRFWLDWGLPATLLWLGLEFQKQFTAMLRPESVERLLVTCGLAAALFLSSTSDLESRWTRNLTKEYLVADDPSLAGWLPGTNGIIYSADMDVFFDTFFKNPKAPWRYALGFEPALMLPKNLEVFDKVVWNNGDVRAYEPWVKKMGPNDRLIIPSPWLKSGEVPVIPELEWAFVAKKLWIGRLRTRTNAPAVAPPAK